MKNTLEKKAKTVEEAIESALEELQETRENVEIEILEEGSKGLLGIIGAKQACVRVTIKEGSNIDNAKKFLIDILDTMEVDAKLSVEENDDNILFRIDGEKVGIVIGRRGETLDSIQYLTSLVFNKNTAGYKKVVVDVGNYRQRREETLIELASKLADKVIKYKKNVTLEPMNPYERRIIHASLQDNKYVDTFSMGDEPNRRIVIKLKH